MACFTIPRNDAQENVAAKHRGGVGQALFFRGRRPTEKGIRRNEGEVLHELIVREEGEILRKFEHFLEMV